MLFFTEYEKFLNEESIRKIEEDAFYRLTDVHPLEGSLSPQFLDLIGRVFLFQEKPQIGKRMTMSFIVRNILDDQTHVLDWQTYPLVDLDANRFVFKTSKEVYYCEFVEGTRERPWNA